jgi:hypothetical protein
MDPITNQERRVAEQEARLAYAQSRVRFWNRVAVISFTIAGLSALVGLISYLVF